MDTLRRESVLALRLARQRLTDPLATPVVADIDAVLAGEAIGRAVAELGGIGVADNITPLIQKQAALPTQFSQWPAFIANLLYIPALGSLYFLVLQGLAQGLNLGLDIFYELRPEGEDEEDVLVEEVEDVEKE